MSTRPSSETADATGRIVCPPHFQISFPEFRSYPRAAFCPFITTCFEPSSVETISGVAQQVGSSRGTSHRISPVLAFRQKR